MFRRTLPLLAILALCITAAAHPGSGAAKWPSWLSIEAPVSPYEPATRGAVLLVHTMAHQGAVRIADLRGRAEGVVNGARRSLDLHFDATPTPGVFALRRQWPAEGTWLLRITFQSTTAIVSLDHEGAVAFARVPTERRSGIDLPRAVSQQEVDSTLAALASR